MRILKDSLIALVVVLLVSAAAVTVSAQGRGSGKGNAGGPPSSSNAGGNRGSSASDTRSNGRADASDNAPAKSSDNAADKSKGRSEHAQQVAKDRNMNGNELNRYNGISKRLGTTPEKMHSLYLTASKLNPNLTFGQFVSAHTVANNLSGRYPRVTPDAILLGLQNGQSMGQTLKTLRVEPSLADRAEKEAKKQIKELM